MHLGSLAVCGVFADLLAPAVYGILRRLVRLPVRMEDKVKAAFTRSFKYQIETYLELRQVFKRTKIFGIQPGGPKAMK